MAPSEHVLITINSKAERTSTAFCTNAQRGMLWYQQQGQATGEVFRQKALQEVIIPNSVRGFCTHLFQLSPLEMSKI